MPAATNGIRKVQRGLPRSPGVAPIPKSIGPAGGRSVVPSMQRAPRIKAANTRDYAKQAGPQSDGFDLPGFRQGE